MPRKRKSLILTVFEKKLGPPQGWAGNCYGIAMKAVEEKLVPKGSVAVYGHWLGPVHAKSMFNIGVPFVQHGWVKQPDGLVCDPTRWVFEHVEPYIYIGESDCYDEGGNKFRTRSLGGPPGYDSEDRQFKLTVELLPKAAWNFVERLLRLENSQVEPGVVCYRQLHWLGNQDPAALGVHAAAIYAALAALGHKAIVPWDNWQLVERIKAASR